MASLLHRGCFPSSFRIVSNNNTFLIGNRGFLRNKASPTIMKNIPSIPSLPSASKKVLILIIMLSYMH